MTNSAGASVGEFGSCLRWAFFWAFSACFSWRARSFCRFVKVVRELPAIHHAPFTHPKLDSAGTKTIQSCPRTPSMPLTSSLTVSLYTEAWRPIPLSSDVHSVCCSHIQLKRKRLLMTLRKLLFG